MTEETESTMRKEYIFGQRRFTNMTIKVKDVCWLVDRNVVTKKSAYFDLEDEKQAELVSKILDLLKKKLLICRC